jgi:hypothetical protein
MKLMKNAIKLLIVLIVGSLVVTTTSCNATDNKEQTTNHDQNRQLTGGGVGREVELLQEAMKVLFREMQNSYATPFQIRYLSYYTTMFWNCVAVYSDDYKDALTQTRPQVQVTDKSRHICSTRAVCAVQAAETYNELAGIHIPGYSNKMQQLGVVLVAPTMNPTLKACTALFLENDKIQCYQDIMQYHDFDPIIVGQVVAQLAYEYSIRDGFNSLGTDGGSQVNCHPYRDTVSQVNIDNLAS